LDIRIKYFGIFTISMVRILRKNRSQSLRTACGVE